jgi:DNA-directed RNA polymerase specialized sigma24 family protein
MEQQDVRPMDENQLLQQLVSEAKSHPNRSAKRRIALNKLIVEIYRSPSLKKPVNNFNTSNYRDIYDEALTITCAEIHRRIDSYDPTHPFMAWVNSILNFRLIDVANKHQNQGITQIPRSAKPKWWNIDARPINEQGETGANDAWENQLPPIDRDEDRSLLRDFITEDLEGRFSERHIQNLPDATFKNIYLMQSEGRTWREIAEHFRTSIPTASSFYRRELDENGYNLLGYLQKSLVIKQ